MKLLEELKWRGLLHDIMPGTEEQLDKEMTKAYAGFDPSSDSLHIGNLVPIIVLKHLQNHGHAPIALVGGATGMIGDPSGKSSERNLLDIATLRHNETCLKNQLAKFLDFSENKANKAELVNNFDWFKDFSFLDFIRDVGKHITVNYMMSKDSVQKRLESGMSFTEFSYQLIQGYDFYYLHKHKNVKLQAAGSDQWGNIVTGTELIRRIGGGEGFAFTAPLITKADGSKFGKSESGNVWLDPVKTSPYQFYQFWLNVSDLDAEKYIKVFTFLEPAVIEQLIAAHREEPHLFILQKKLAEEVTCFVHSREAYEKALASANILFGKADKKDLLSLDKADFMALMQGVKTYQYTLKGIQNNENIVNILADSKALSSKTEARKLLQANAITINMEKGLSIESTLGVDDLIFGNYILGKKGKKDFFLIECLD